ncbi:MAG: phosphoribosylglycinamide formyltransferase [Gammaproteobacteria bacterium]
MSGAVCRLVVLGSGAGTNFEALALAAGQDYEIVAVVSDRPGAPILERARRRDIPALTLTTADYGERAAHDTALARILGEYHPDLVALAGYLRLIGPATLAAWTGRMLNVHPALLPAFPGLDTHVRAIAAGAHEHGTTVHFVTADLDAGPRIVQGRLMVRNGETADELAKRVQAIEHRIYPLAVRWCASGHTVMRENRIWFDGRPLDEPIMIEEQDSCA